MSHKPRQYTLQVKKYLASFWWPIRGRCDMLTPWTKCELLNPGRAEVNLSVNKKTGHLFVAKSCNCGDKHKTAEILNEVTVYLVLDSPRIVQYLGSSFDTEDGGKKLNLFLEYMPGGSLRKHIERLGGHLEESLIRTYTRSIVEAIHHLHSKGVVHCDIKADNILIGLQGAKLCGFSKSMFVDQKSHGAMKGTSAWMAPEVVAELEQGFPSDIWSLGCTVIEMATGQDPWAKVSSKGGLRSIQLSRKIPDLRSLSREGQKFVTKCLVRNPKERRTASQLLQEEFLANEIGEADEHVLSRALARIRATFPDRSGKRTTSATQRRQEEISKLNIKVLPVRPSPSPSSMLAEGSTGFQSTDAITDPGDETSFSNSRFSVRESSSALLDFELERVHVREKARKTVSSKRPEVEQPYTLRTSSHSNLITLPRSPKSPIHRGRLDHSPALSKLETPKVNAWETPWGKHSTGSTITQDFLPQPTRELGLSVYPETSLPSRVSFHASSNHYSTQSFKSTTQPGKGCIHGQDHELATPETSDNIHKRESPSSTHDILSDCSDQSPVHLIHYNLDTDFRKGALDVTTPGQTRACTIHRPSRNAGSPVNDNLDTVSRGNALEASFSGQLPPCKLHGLCTNLAPVGTYESTHLQPPSLATDSLSGSSDCSSASLLRFDYLKTPSGKAWV